MDLKKAVGPFSVKTYQARRKELSDKLSKISKDFTALFWSGSELIRNNDNHFDFRAHSDFLYLTGFSEPETLLIIQRQQGKTKVSIGVRPRDLSPNRGSEIWEGERIGVERAPQVLGVDQAFDIDQTEKNLRMALAKTRTIFWSFGEFTNWDTKLIGMISALNHAARGLPHIEGILDPRMCLHEMRKKKSADEIKIMRESARIGSEGHIQAASKLRAGLYEYHIQAELEREFRRLGSSEVSYTPIVASGNNACTLHYRANADQLRSGDLLLIDAGCEFKGYASDITRCYPVSGKFTPAQKEVYEWVLKSQLAAIKAVRPGASWRAPHLRAIEVLSIGLAKMKIIKASPESILKKGLWRSFMPHGTSHWLGMDVHDSGTYFDLGDHSKDVKLEVGNVLTIEPGLYFRKDDRKVPAAFRGIGVRIEDDVLVTRTGVEVLTKSCPKTVDEIESITGPRL